MPLAECEPTIPAIKRPYTYTVNTVATGIDLFWES